MMLILRKRDGDLESSICINIYIYICVCSMSREASL